MLLHTLAESGGQNVASTDGFIRAVDEMLQIVTSDTVTNPFEDVIQLNFPRKFDA